MQNFYYSIPTKVAFGEGQLKKLSSMVKSCGRKVLLVYGGGSIKRSGLYDQVIEILEKHKISYSELSGVEPNPRVSTVRRGIELCREEDIDVLLPIGGGSTIDCAKGIAAGFYYEGDVWELVLKNELVSKVLPIVAILTLAATGSEMDPFAVISNEDTMDKMDISSPLLYPKYAIMDPTFTYSVPAYQTASGTADIMSHVFELYFNGVPGAYMQERMMEGLLKTCIHYGPIACEDPTNYDARANLMWASSWAINGFLASGKAGAWPCHAMEHQLSAYYDVTHGHGLAILTPVWMQYILNDKTVEMIATYGRNVFGIQEGSKLYEVANKAIVRTKQVYQQMGLSTSLRDIGITDKSKFEEMAMKAAVGLDQCYVPLRKEDVVKIYEMAF